MASGIRMHAGCPIKCVAVDMKRIQGVANPATDISTFPYTRPVYVRIKLLRKKRK